MKCLPRLNQRNFHRIKKKRTTFSNMSPPFLFPLTVCGYQEFYVSFQFPGLPFVTEQSLGTKLFSFLLFPID